MSEQPKESRLTPVAQKFILHWGEMGTKWGINRTVAQVHALLFISPQPIPADEMQRTYDWLKSWGMLERTASPLTLVDMNVQNHAHQAAE